MTDRYSAEELATLRRLGFEPFDDEKYALRAQVARLQQAITTIQRKIAWSDAHEDRDRNEGLIVLAVVVEDARQAIEALPNDDLEPLANS